MNCKGFKDTVGSALISSLLFVAAGSALFYSYFSYQSSVARTQARITADSRFVAIIRSVANALSDPEQCAMALSGQRLGYDPLTGSKYSPVPPWLQGTPTSFPLASTEVTDPSGYPQSGGPAGLLGIVIGAPGLLSGADDLAKFREPIAANTPELEVALENPQCNPTATEKCGAELIIRTTARSVLQPPRSFRAWLQFAPAPSPAPAISVGSFCKLVLQENPASYGEAWIPGVQVLGNAGLGADLPVRTEFGVTNTTNYLVDQGSLRSQIYGTGVQGAFRPATPADVENAGVSVRFLAHKGVTSDSNNHLCPEALSDGYGTYRSRPVFLGGSCTCSRPTDDYIEYGWNTYATTLDSVNPATVRLRRGDRQPGALFCSPALDPGLGGVENLDAVFGFACKCRCPGTKSARLKDGSKAPRFPTTGLAQSELDVSYPGNLQNRGGSEYRITDYVTGAKAYTFEGSFFDLMESVDISYTCSHPVKDKKVVSSDLPRDYKLPVIENTSLESEAGILGVDFPLAQGAHLFLKKENSSKTSEAVLSFRLLDLHPGGAVGPFPNDRVELVLYPADPIEVGTKLELELYGGLDSPWANSPLRWLTPQSFAGSNGYGGNSVKMTFAVGAGYTGFGSAQDQYGNAEYKPLRVDMTSLLRNKVGNGIIDSKQSRFLLVIRLKNSTNSPDPIRLFSIFSGQSGFGGESPWRTLLAPYLEITRK